MPFLLQRKMFEEDRATWLKHQFLNMTFTDHINIKTQNGLSECKLLSFFLYFSVYNVSEREIILFQFLYRLWPRTEARIRSQNSTLIVPMEGQGKSAWYTTADHDFHERTHESQSKWYSTSANTFLTYVVNIAVKL